MLWGSSPEDGPGGAADYEIRQGSRKAVLVALATEAWKKGRYDARAELKEARGREISSRVFKRQDAIRGFIVGMLVPAHVLFLGKKGAAKSMLGRLLCDAVAWSGLPEGQDPYFRAQLGRDSILDELFGPVSSAGFENDTFRRNTAGMLPEAKIGLIEEIYKSNRTVLNRLLTLLAEGLFKNGTEPERPVPLRLVVVTSNELPDERDDPLDAFHDRFLLRYDVATPAPISSHPGPCRATRFG